MPEQGASPKMNGDSMLPTTNHEQVLAALVRRKSMAFLELTSVCNLRDDELNTIISWLETRGAVSVSNRNDIFQEVVTLSDKGVDLARKLANEKEFQLSASAA
jgi:predicted transcriptional regulator